MSKNPIINSLYKCPNVPSHELHNLKVDGNGLSILRRQRSGAILLPQGLINILFDDSSGCKVANDND